MKNASQSKTSSEDVDKSKRDFLKLTVISSTFITFGGLLYTVNALNPSLIPLQREWPKVKIANIKDLKVGEALIFNYPLDNTPNILVKLGVKVRGGVGPDGDIVAYSQLCQHLGCKVRYLHPERYENVKVPENLKGKHLFYCGCHIAFYDVEEDAKPLVGPPLYPLPPVFLEYKEDTGDIIAYGMGPPVIYGHGPPGSTEVLRNLRGGRLVG
ncbi:MAG: Rieske 2Fe-2S domain-containing protein [Nitrososphaerota archaeon]|nr:Rieske 2Fe-2S domain-containing protein [Nitrososphaerota archaeon]